MVVCRNTRGILLVIWEYVVKFCRVSFKGRPALALVMSSLYRFSLPTDSSVRAGQSRRCVGRRVGYIVLHVL